MAPSGTSQASQRDALCEELVAQITRVDRTTEAPEFHRLSALAKKTLRTTKTSTDADMFEMDRKFNGLVEKAQIFVQNDLADALDLSYKKVKTDVSERGIMDAGIKMNRLPDHLQLLVLLSLPPSSATHTYASIILQNQRDPMRVPSALTWETILSEEPFEGEHWEGVLKGRGDAARSHRPRTKRSRSLTSSSSSLSSLLDGEDVATPASSSPATPLGDRVDTSESDEISAQVRKATEQIEFEGLLERQYWNGRWRMNVDMSAPFDLGKPSTLGPALLRVSGGSDSDAFRMGANNGNFIPEVDAVREVLLALQGLDNTLFEFEGQHIGGHTTVVKVRKSVPRTVHHSSAAYYSILSNFAEVCTIPYRLDAFVAQSGSTSGPTGHRCSLTLQAFSEAVDKLVRQLRLWCSAREEHICLAQAGQGASLPVSLLSLATEVEQEAEVLRIVLEVVTDVQQYIDKSISCASSTEHLSEGVSVGLPVRLLDGLFAAYESHFHMGNHAAAAGVFRVFRSTAQPAWACVVRWLQHGNIHETGDDNSQSGCNDDFFISCSMEIPLVDPCFWSSAYTIRSTPRDARAVPSFLRPFADEVLASGKARVILQALEREDGKTALPPVDFAGILGAHSGQSTLQDSRQSQGRTLAPMTPEELILQVQDYIRPLCEKTQRGLYSVLHDNCHIWEHLDAVEGICFMRRGDLMGDFSDILFDRIENSLSWHDFHFLNVAFRDLVASRSHSWVDPSLVRFWYRKPQEHHTPRLSRCLEGLFVEYEVPFPLVYLFGPEVLQTYSTVFTLLLQVRRAKYLIDRILVRRGFHTRADYLPGQDADDTKRFFALRSKLSWFINAFMDYLSTAVIHVELQRFHAAMRSAQTLDELIKRQTEHLERVARRFFLCDSTVAVHRAILSILDVALSLADCYANLRGDATLDVSRRTLHVFGNRSRRIRRQRRRLRNQDLIGFSDSIPQDEDSDSSSSEVEAETDKPEMEDSKASIDASFSFSDENFAARIERLSDTMDKLIRTIRRGAEKVSASGQEASATYGIFSFALEAWDI